MGRALQFFTISTLLMGGTWFPHVLFDDTQTEYGYLTSVLSCLVGVYFFIFFVCKKKIPILLRKRMQLLKINILSIRNVLPIKLRNILLRTMFLRDMLLRNILILYTMLCGNPRERRAIQQENQA
jgi:hypothetical protein